MTQQHQDILITCILSLVIIVCVSANAFNKHKKIKGRECEIVNSAEDVKYLITHEPFISCEGYCNINYRDTALNAFRKFSKDFIIFYCGEDKDELSTNIEKSQ